VDGSELWGRNMGMGKEDRNIEIGEKIFKMNFGSGGKNTRIYGKERDAEE